MISVALCTRNGEAYLAEQLTSILRGTCRPDEIVVSDDASHDATVAIAASVLAADGIRHQILINDPPLGVTANFARAIVATHGEIVVLSDQDDVWMPDRLAAAVEILEREPRVLLHHADAELVDSANEPLGLGLFEALALTERELAMLPTVEGFEALLRRNLVTGAVTAFRRELLDLAVPFPPDWVHDEWLAILAASRNGLYTDRRRLVRYRQHGRNEIGMVRRTLRMRIRRVLGAEEGRLAGLAVRAEVLARRLEQVGAADQLVEAVKSKAEFEGARSELPRSRWGRIWPVLRLARTGAYARYASQGRFDVLRDLGQRRTHRS